MASATLVKMSVQKPPSLLCSEELNINVRRSVNKIERQRSIEQKRCDQGV